MLVTDQKKTIKQKRKKKGTMQTRQAKTTHTGCASEANEHHKLMPIPD